MCNGQNLPIHDCVGVCTHTIGDLVSKGTVCCVDGKVKH